MDNIIKSYFELWNQKDLNGLSKLFHTDIKLQDWTMSSFGKQNVLQSNQDIFNSAPEIHATLLNLSRTGDTFYCELEINTDKNKLKVVDIIKTSDNKILEITAFKI